MKNFSALGLSALLLLGTTACQQNTGSENTENTDTVKTVAAVSLADVPASPEFPDASLSLGNVTATPQGDSAKVSFNFNVKNYELKAQTTDAPDKLCSNSKDGQHIHFILDNQPYSALYEPKKEMVLPKNSEHFLVAFLSRSYHQSLKNKGAALLLHFKIDENGKYQKLETPTTPMITYSRPKGDYLGKDAENLLLDFYVWNATLGNDYKVKAQIKSEGLDTTFTLTEWKSYFLKNMPMGKATIQLTLVDKDGNKINSTETEVSRDINLAAEEPMK
jgi:hypothetical protein